MLTLAQTLSKAPSEIYIGVVELEEYFVVGTVDDPIGLDLPSLHLGYPLTFIKKIIPMPMGDIKKKMKSRCSFILPDLGLPYERILETDNFDLYRGDDIIGKAYLEALRDIIKAPSIAEFEHIYPLASPNQ